MYLHCYCKLPETFNDCFLKNDSIHSYNSRSTSKIHIDFKRTNSLPNDLNEKKNQATHLRKHYIHMYNQRKILFDALIDDM